MVLTAVTGPDVCFARVARERIGIQVSTPMRVGRAGAAVRFQVGDPMDYPEYVGTVDANEFVAETPSWPLGFHTCPDGTTLSGTFEGRVAGRFTEEGHRLTATDIWTYHFSPGDVQYVFEWTASTP